MTSTNKSAAEVLRAARNTTDYENERNERWLRGLLDGVQASNHAAEIMAQRLYVFAWASGPHTHVAGTMIGRNIDECALCGRDIREEIHSDKSIKLAEGDRHD